MTLAIFTGFPSVLRGLWSCHSLSHQESACRIDCNDCKWFAKTDRHGFRKEVPSGASGSERLAVCIGLKLSKIGVHFFFRSGSSCICALSTASVPHIARCDILGTEVAVRLLQQTLDFVINASFIQSCLLLLDCLMLMA